MKVYFACVTTYNVFVAYLLSKTEYYDPSIEKILIINDEIDTIDSLYDNFKKVGVWSSVIKIKHKNQSEEIIQGQIDKIPFTNEDVLHFFTYGMKYSSLLFNSFPQKGKIIFTDEGYATYTVGTFFEKWRKMYKIPKDVIDLNRIDEILLFDIGLYDNSILKPLRQIDISRIINNEQIGLEVKTELETIFSIKDDFSDYDIIFFDQYPSMGGFTTFEEERYILKNVHDITKDYKIIVKQHPSEPDMHKYEGLDFSFFKNQSCPWEAYCLYEYLKGKKTTQKTFITYNSTSVFNYRLIFRNLLTDANIILIYKILDKNARFISDTEYIDKFISIYGNNNIFIPVNFTDLNITLNKLMNNEIKTPYKDLYIKELESELKLTNSIIEENAGLFIEHVNFSTLFLVDDKGKRHQVDNRIYTNTNIFDIVFKIPPSLRKTIKEIQWYAIRGVLVKIKINKIVIVNFEKESKIEKNEIVHYGDVDEDGYIYIQGFDPTFTITYNYENIEISEILISGEWKFNKSYNEIIRVSNTMSQNLAERLQNAELSLSNLRDTNLNLLNEINSYSKLKDETELIILNLNREKINFENTITELKTQIEIKNNTLIDLQNNIRNKDEYISSLMIALDEVKKNYYVVINSKWWKLITPCRSIYEKIKKNLSYFKMKS